MVDEALDIAEKLSLVSEHWSPKVVGRLNESSTRATQAALSPRRTTTR